MTDKGGSSFHCGLDGSPLAVCPEEYVSPSLAAGHHQLRVVATDRFGLVQLTPTVLAFVVDSTLPHTIAMVVLPADGDRQPVLVMGSDKPAHVHVLSAGRRAGRARPQRVGAARRPPAVPALCEPDAA